MENGAGFVLYIQNGKLEMLEGYSYDEKWQYVRNNPVRHGLVESAEKWPYQGELNRLEWHDV